MSRPLVRWLRLALFLGLLQLLLPGVPTATAQGAGPHPAALASAAAAPAALPPIPSIPGRFAAMHGKPVEVPRLRTRFSHTVANGDGTFTATYTLGAQNYRDATGAWQPIDDTLVPATTGGFAYQNHANAYPLLLPPSLSSPVTVITGTETLAFGLVGAQGAVAVTGNVGTDANALPGVSVSDAAEPDAMKESLILVGPTAPSAYTFTLSLRPGLTAQPTANGGVSVLAAGGRPAFILPPPVVTDSSHIAAGISQTASFTLGSDGATLTLHVDPT
jgi:hypothetical protein